LKPTPRLEVPPHTLSKAVQIFNGLGAGNIGDELMMHGMWPEVPRDIELYIILHENSRQQRQPYPPRFQYSTISLPPQPFELAHAPAAPGLLAGTTSITDAEGWGWPLDFLAPRVRHFTDRGLPVDAVGVGVDFLTTPEGRRLFGEAFRDIRSWSVRNDTAREALLDLGVPAERIVVGADWAWLYLPPQDYGNWAEEYLTSLGLRVREPLLIVNLFWQGQGEVLPIWPTVAAALDRLYKEQGLQIAFFCNECRHPGFDREAAEFVRAGMRSPSTLIPNLYYGPGEAIAILQHATVTLGQRYHFCVESVLGATVPVVLGRSPKIAGLCEELGIAPLGSLEHVDEEEICATVRDSIRRRDDLLRLLAEKRTALTERARHNFDLFLPAYARAY
jgi:polysaccharide pyruvyl transferase WcaK-like protein